MEPHFGFSFRNRDDLNKIGVKQQRRCLYQWQLRGIAAARPLAIIKKDLTESWSELPPTGRARSLRTA